MALRVEANPCCHFSTTAVRCRISVNSGTERLCRLACVDVFPIVCLSLSLDIRIVVLGKYWGVAWLAQGGRLSGTPKAVFFGRFGSGNEITVVCGEASPFRDQTDSELARHQGFLLTSEGKRYE